MPERKLNPIRCLAISSPSQDSAYISITRADGSTERFDLERTQLRLLNIESSIKLEKWPENDSTAA